MKLTTFFLPVAFTFLIVEAFSQKDKLPRYKDPNVSTEERVKDLLSRMTTEEKFFQLFMIPGDLDKMEPGQYQHGIFGLQVSAGSKGAGETQQLLKYNTAESGITLTKKINEIQKHFVTQTRLGIPIIAFDEALHGLVRDGATVFPQAIGLAASFDTTLMRQVATAIAKETKARGIRQVLSPVINIASDVRWGRVEETYGEDPFLTSAMGVAFVSPFEKSGIITTPKHLIANVGDGGRDSYPIHFSKRFLEEIHFPPFRACIEQGGSRSVMTSYNSLDGTPMTSNDWMLNQKLKKDWKFGGFVVSDASATGGSIVLHYTSPDFPTAAHQAITNGLDVIFQTEYRHHKLFDAKFLNGQINQQRFEDAVTRVLRAKFDLGLFENPYVTEDAILALAKDKAHKELARKAALESIVLLKNTKQVLPFSKNVKSIAVVGIEATAARLGGYSGPGNRKVSILDGIKRRANNIKVAYAEGCGIENHDWIVVPAEFLSHEKTAGLKGEYFKNITLQGDPAIVRMEEKIDFLWTLSSPERSIPKDFYSARWTGKIKGPMTGAVRIGLDGNDGFRLFLNNQLLIDNWNKQTHRTILADFVFKKDQYYNIKIEFYEPVGNARLKLIWDVGINNDWAKRLEDAIDAAKAADVVVVAAGIHEGEFQDRAILSLPGHQEEMILKLAETGKPIVVVLVGGSAITMSKWEGKVNGIIDIWYPGEEGGAAVAQVLFGDYNPAGRLPITFPVHEAQLPLVYNHKPTGRGDDYHNLTGLPLFPFGYGLSYSNFEYSALKLDKNAISADDSVVLSCKIKNVGKAAGDEVVQLYIRDMLASVARPVMELKGFKRIHLLPDESKEVRFKIDPSMLTMLDESLNAVVEPGTFRIMLGASSRDIRLKGNLEVVKN